MICQCVIKNDVCFDCKDLKIHLLIFLTFSTLKYYWHIVIIRSSYTHQNSILQVDLDNQCCSRIPICRKTVVRDTLSCNNNHFDPVVVQMCMEQDTMKTSGVRCFCVRGYTGLEPPPLSFVGRR